jgi:MFS family permease
MTATAPSAGRDTRIALAVSSVAHTFAHMFVLLYATVVLVIETEFGFSYADLQWLAVPGFVMFGVAALPAGWLGDRWSAPGMMAVFFFGVGGAAVVTGLADTRLGLLIGLTAIGTFAAIYHPVGISWLVRNAANPGRALGINGVFGSMGTAGAALVAGVLAEFFGWRAAFLVPGIISIAVGAGFVALIARGAVDESRGNAQSAAPATPARDVSRAFLALFATVIAVGLIFQSTSVAMPKIFADRLVADGGALAAGSLVALVYAISAATQLIGGELADRFSLKRVYMWTQILQIPVILIAFLTFNYGLMVLAIAMVGLNVAGQPAENALLARYTPLAWRGRMFGVKFVLTLGVSTLGVALVPAIADWTGSLDLLFIALALFAGSAGITASLLPSDRAPARVGDPVVTDDGD